MNKNISEDLRKVIPADKTPFFIYLIKSSVIEKDNTKPSLSVNQIVYKPISRI